MLAAVVPGRHQRPRVLADAPTQAACDWPFGGTCTFMACPKHQPANYAAVSARRTDAY